MKLSQIIKQARYGELANMSEEAKSDTVIVNYINIALVALYSRFSEVAFKVVAIIK